MKFQSTNKRGSSDWTTGSYTDQTGQGWYWDGLHGWTPVGMTYSRPNDPAIIKKYFKGSKPNVPPPPLDPNYQNQRQSTPSGPDFAAKIQSLLPR